MSPAERFRVTTNGVLFRVEEYKKPPLPRSAQPWEWQEVWGGRALHADQTNGFTGFDTRGEAEDHRVWLIKAVEIAAHGWVPVEDQPQTDEEEDPFCENCLAVCGDCSHWLEREGTATRQPEQAWATSALLAITEAKRLIGQHWPLPFRTDCGEEPVAFRLRTLEMLSSVIDRAAKGEAGRMSTEEGS